MKRALRFVAAVGALSVASAVAVMPADASAARGPFYTCEPSCVAHQYDDECQSWCMADGAYCPGFCEGNLLLHLCYDFR